VTAPGPAYCGRFAPSPTGALHFGSLLAALASCLEARSCGGRWLLRMEDVDRGREQAGAAADILRTLEAFGFVWDGPVVYQSDRDARYAAAFARLRARGLVYGCACTRREIADSAVRGAVDGGLVYPGSCREGLAPGQFARAWRLRVDAEAVIFDDAVQGRQSQNLAEEVGDFVLRRADDLFAYQLAVVVDDAEQGVTHVVRGADLLASTPRQIYLQRQLGLPTPHYAHLPVATNAGGEKWSKQTCAPPLDPGRAADQLRQALAFLGQAPGTELDGAALADVWRWACANWSLARVPAVLARPWEIGA
jgi:glutamyl-Q tRNA(Asp) synthetase